MIEATKLRYYKHLTRAAYHTRPRDLFREFVTMAACTLSMGWREEEYLQVVGRLGATPGVAGTSTAELTACAEAFELLIDEMEAHPYQDLLGPVWMELNAGGADWSGEFYTPQEVSTAMAKVMFAGERLEIPTDRPLTISEPSCGSANMVLAVVEVLAQQKIPPSRIWVEARDISRTACDMAYVNLSLYGVPGVVIHSNTLSMEEWGRWPTRFKPVGHKSAGERLRLALGLDLAGALVAAIEGGRELIAAEPAEVEPANENTGEGGEAREETSRVTQPITAEMRLF